MPSSTRRRFLEDVGLGAAAAMTVAAATPAKAISPNDTIHVGAIGCGGRFQALAKALLKIPGVKLAAVCDVWDENLEKAVKIADPQAFKTKDYRALLDRKEIDAVLIAAPDHWHARLAIEACNAGKDVYVEKPLTHDAAEGPAIVKSQDDNKRILQVGMQQRSMPQIQQAHDVFKSGQLGKISKVHLSWNRNTLRAPGTPQVDPRTVDWKMFLGAAREQPFDAYRFRNWRWFWDFGGGILTDLMVHFLDVAHWYLDLDRPIAATTAGQWYQNKDRWETPDTIETLLTYGDDKPLVHFEGTFSNARNGARIEFQGTEATLYIDRGRYEVIPERGKKIKASELVLGDGPRGADFYDNPDGELVHLTNWIECVRSRKTPNAPAQAGVSSAAAAHFANRAFREARVVKG
ncbi:MAG TPA: Gfo/Idh/MocA family oxidoreductase [Pirellulales bacterium]|nr:Gfo/Idh/MocA family oxidoreductase [Pirellulales bacterium]